MPGKNKTEIIAEPGKQELFINREFDASRADVFRAFGEPELLMQWMGPREMKMEIEKLDNKSHGSYRFIHTDGKGNRYVFNGIIHEVAAPQRVIRTFEFEGLPERGHVSLEFLNLESLAGNRTRIVIQVVFKSVDDRDAMIQSGMEKGVVDSHNRLDELIEKGF